MDDMQIQMNNIDLRLPAKRQGRDKTAAAIVVVATLLTAILFSHAFGSTFKQLKEDITQLGKKMFEKTPEELVWLFMMLLASTVLALILSEFLRRMCLLWEELYHVKERYNHSTVQAFTSAMSVSLRSTVIFAAVALFCLFVICYQPYRLICTAFVFIHVIIYLTMHFFGLLGPQEAQLLHLAEEQMNLGQAFAWQYYFGYLKIVLPDFLERVQEYESKEGVEIWIHKLFILLPESCQLTPDLSDHANDHGLLEHAKNLRDVIRDRSGTKERKYTNPVYRITTKQDIIYCCMEGAAILNSLHEMCKGEKLTGLTDEKKFQHMVQFHSALKEILLNDSELGNLVELVCYKDLDVNGEQVKIVDVVARRIQAILAQK